MENIIKTLCKLQDIDLQYSAINNQLQSSPNSILELEQNLSELQSKLSEAKNQLSTCEKKQRTYESDIKDNEQNIKRSQEKTKSIKSNKEYQALLKEIEETQNKNTVLEEEVLQCMYDKEALSSVVKEKQENVQSIENQLSKEKNDYEKHRKEIKQQFKNLESERQVLESQLPQNILKRYQYLIKVANGVAVGFVEKGTCSACHTIIPPQYVIELRKSIDIQYCMTCQRFLIWRNEDK